MSYLKQANEAFRKKDYQTAIQYYQMAQKENPSIQKIVEFNIQQCKQKQNNDSVIPCASNSSPLQIDKEPLNDIEYVSKDHPAANYLMNHQVYTVDIVLPVYNAFEDVKLCLESVEKHTDGFRVTTYVINDASEKETTDLLREFCQNRPSFVLIEHEANKGYTKTVNDGLKASKGDYVVTLNSDTIVTKGWLRGLVCCMQSDNKIGVVGALSNAASWQNVPNLMSDEGGFAVNQIPYGISIEEMAYIVRTVSKKIYPRLPFINGFCYMISRDVLNLVGYMDEDNFPIGYGEENDYCIRVLDIGYELAVADDVYVFHAKSKSFGHEKRKQLSDQGTQKLKEKHSGEKFIALVDKVKETKLLDQVRERITEYLDNYSKYKVLEKKLLNFEFNVLFLLPGAGGGGGSHSVVQEVMEMRRLGVNAKIAIESKNFENFISNYSDIKRISTATVKVDDDMLIEVAKKFDVVVATYFTTVEKLKSIVNANDCILPAYYVQDYEPWFCPVGSKIHKQALDSYTLIDNALLFAKTNWIVNKVYEEHSVRVSRVLASIDHDVYKPIGKDISEKLVVSAMVRPQTPRRAAGKTMKLLKAIKGQFGENVDIIIFGCEDSEQEFLKLERNFSFNNKGVLNRTDVASVLALSDIFIDLSDYQAFGRTSLEAMATGCVPIVPLEGGGDEYAINGENSLVVDTSNYASVKEAVFGILNTPYKIKEMKANCLQTAAKYSVHAAAISELNLFAKALIPIKRLRNTCNQEVLEQVCDESVNECLTLCIPTYNRPKELEHLLESIFRNSTIVAKVKVLVSDDGSFGHTQEIVLKFQEKYGKNKLTYFNNKINLGYALNYLSLFKKAKTDYLMVLGDDNLIFPESIIRSINLIDSGRFDFISSPWYEAGKIAHRAWKGHKFGKLKLEDFFNSSDHAPGLIYKKDTFLKYIPDLEKRISNHCHFAAVFPQVFLVMNVLANGGIGEYVDFSMGTETSVLPSGIKDPSGNEWRTYSSMLLQSHDLNSFILNSYRGNFQKDLLNISQVYYMRYLLKVMELDARKAL